MKLFIKNNLGQKVTLSPSMPDRKSLYNKIGKTTFTLDGSDFEYHIDDVVAEPEKDTAFGWAMLLGLFSVLITHEVLISGGISLIMFLMAKFYHKLDQKHVDKFNASKTWPE